MARIGEVFVMIDRCKGCALCVAACPTDSLRLSRTRNRLGYRVAEYVPHTGCTGCGSCFYACPEPTAISVYHANVESAA